MNLKHSSNITSPRRKIYEKPRINRIQNNKQKNMLQNISNLTSPYITYGFMAQNLVYDKKYDLSNFIAEKEKGEPIVIGTGSYGKVYIYRNLIDKKLYAIKHMDKNRLNKSLKNLQGIYDEIDIQSRIFHQNIVRLLYVKENNKGFDLIMEYAKGGSLFYFLRDNDYLSEKESFKYFSQIINAVYFLHKNDLIHRDIKPENILLYDNNICKLCDFGWCVRLDGKQRSTFCGTTEYMSPEIVNKMEYSKEIDVWSLGILLYEMIHGYSPFKPDKEDFNAKEVIDNIKIHDLKFKTNISNECKELICHMLDKKAENRYKIEDIFNSKFVKKYEKQNLFYPKENIYSFKKSNNDIHSINKLNNIENNNNKFNFNYHLKLNFNQNKKINNLNNTKMLSTFLKNASMITKPSNNKNKEINLKKNIYNLKSNININQKNNLISTSKIKEHSNNNSLSLEEEYKSNNQQTTDFNNKLNLCIPASLRFLNYKNRKLNLSAQKEIKIHNNIDSKKLSSNNLNSKYSIKNKTKNMKINNMINNNNFINEVKSINISSINNNKNYNNSEEKKKKFFMTSRIVYNNKLNNNNNTKLNLFNYYYNGNSKKNSKDKQKDENILKNENISFATVKKLSNEKNLSDKNIINFNNYMATYRDNFQSHKKRKYEKITIFNNLDNYALTSCDVPKDNAKRKNNFSINNISKNSSNNNSKEKLNRRKKVNSLKLDKIGDNTNNIRYYKISSVENNFKLNSKILNSNGYRKNKVYESKNIYDKTQDNINSNNNKNFNHTFSSLSNNKYFNNNYNSLLNSNYEKPQINTNYIFNPKISITLPTNFSILSKSKNNSERKNYKIIYIGKNLETTNLTKLNNFSKSQSFLRPNFLNINNNKNRTEINNLKLFKNKEEDIYYNHNNTKRKRYDLFKKNFYDIPRFNTERDKHKKGNINITSLFNGDEANFMKNKKYIKMNEISKYRNISDRNHKIKSKIKKEISESEKIINIKLETHRFIQPKSIKIERNNLNSLRKINYKKKINNIVEYDNSKMKNKSKEKSNNKNSFSERTLPNYYNKEKEKNNRLNLFSARIANKSKSKSKIFDDTQKTPKKDEDRIKIIPSRLLNKFSLEFNSFKNKGIK